MGDDKWKFTHAFGDPSDDVGFLPLVVPTKQKDKSTTHKARIVSHRMETQSLMRFHVPPQSSEQTCKDINLAIAMLRHCA